MLVVTGYNTTIVQSLLHIVPDEKVVRIKAELDRFSSALTRQVPIDCERYVLAAGLLHSRRIKEQTETEIIDSLAVNLVSTVQICEHVLDSNPHARICVIGSISGFHGSYDTTYAMAKAGLHRYVETRQLRHVQQQLVAVSPGIIEDSGMTERREDTDNLRKRLEAHPKRRFLRAVEVARMVHFLLYVDQGYTTNTVIRMEGGC